MKSKIFVILLPLFFLGFNADCKSFYSMFDKSGEEFVVQIDTSGADKDALAHRVAKVIQNKLDAVKLRGEAVIDPTDASRMTVRVFGKQDTERIKNFLFTSYQLELRKAISPPNPYPIQTYRSSDEAMKVVAADQEVLTYTERDSEEDSSKRFVIVEKMSVINGDDIRDAHAVSYGGKTDYMITFSLKPAGAEKFGEWTNKNINNYIAVVLDKRVRSVAYIKSKISDQGEINGRFTKESAEDIALALSSGYMPATLTVISEKRFEK